MSGGLWQVGHWFFGTLLIGSVLSTISLVWHVNTQRLLQLSLEPMPITSSCKAERRR